MTFKMWPAWKKGMLIGAAISGILIIISVIAFAIRFSGPDSQNLINFWLSAPLYFLLLLVGAFLYTITGVKATLFLVWSFAIILQIGTFAVIGALIGWIIGKIRSRST